WVGAHARAPRTAAAADPVDGAGMTLTPGLIDCHVHLCFDGSPDFISEARVTEPYAAVKCVANAARHLANGVTTVRDLGGFRDVATDVGRAIADGRVPGPRVVASGTALTVTGGHGWNSFARQMKASGAFHVPTIAALAGIIGHPEDVPEYAVAKGKQIWEMAQDALRRSVRNGVRIACGTDAGTPHNPHGSAPKEIVSMVEWGLTPLKALVAATSNAALLLRVSDVCGTVEAGKAGDLVLYEGNPIDDPTGLL